MEKLYLRFLYSLSIGDSLFVRSFKAFLATLLLFGLSYASYGNVRLSDPTLTDVCPNHAVTGDMPSCYLVPTFDVLESVPGDFVIGSDNLTLSPPPGFQFCTTTMPTVTVAGPDVTTSSFTLSTTSLSINFTMATAASAGNSITISGLYLEPLTPATVSGFIFASAQTGIHGLTLGSAGSHFVDVNVGRVIPIGCSITGGGISCTTACPSVGTSCSDSGFTYLLYDYGVLTSCSSCRIVDTTGGPLDFGAQCTNYALYSVHVVDASTGCWDSLPGNKLVITNGDPLIYSMFVGGGAYCAPGPCPDVKMPISEIGIKYYLNVSGTFLVDTILGTGGLIDFGPQCTPGTYIIVATKDSTNCTDTMMGSDVISLLPAPSPYTVSGGGNQCANSTTGCPHIFLSGSDIGNNYQVYCGSTPVGPPVAGTGIALDLGPFCSACTYSVVATLVSSGCTSGMTGTATVTSLPLAALETVTGGGPYCVGGTCPTIGLSSSTSGVTYQLYCGSTPVGLPLTGTGSSISFGTVCAACVYSVQATTTSGCTDTMAGGASVTINPLPNIYTVLGSGSACAGGLGPCPNIGLSNSDLGISYQLFCGTTPIGTPISGTGGPINFGPECTACVYTVEATNVLTGCQNTMAGSASITTTTVPPITGATHVCIATSSLLSDATGGGTWASSNTAVATVVTASFTTGLVTGVTGGTALITYTIPSGCYTTFLVTVPSLPVPLILGGHALCAYGAPDTVCNADTSSRLWSSTLVTVTFIDTNCVLVTPFAAGVGTITYTESSGCSITATVQVNPLPCDIAAETVCVNNSISFSSCPPGGTWSSSNTAVGTIGSSSGVATGVSAGTSIITYTNTSGCYKTTTLNVLPIPATITGLPGLCFGNTDTLSDTSHGGTWSSSVTTVGTIGSLTGIVTGVGLGTTVITYEFPTGCLITDTILVNPVPGGIAGPTHVCVFNSITLHDAGHGTWTLSDTTIAKIDSTTGVLTGYSYGFVTVSYTIGLGCNALYTVRVDTLPPAISGYDSVCVGPSIHLHEPIADSLIGVWTSSNSTIAFVDPTGDVTGISVGTATITFTDTLSGCYVTDSINVLASPPNITGDSTICVMATTNLSILSSGGIWFGNNPSVATIDSTSGLVTGISPGTVIISYVLPSGCTSQLFTLTVTPVPTPIGGPDSVCVGLTITDTDSVTGGIWSTTAMGITIGSTTGLITGFLGGTFPIIYTVGNCSIPRTIDVLGRDTISGPTTICLGDTITLTDSIGGIWSSSNPGVANTIPISTIQTQVVGVSSGTAIITFTNVSGCVSYYTVTVNPLTAIYPYNPSICVGQSISLLDTTAGGPGTWSTCCTTVDTISTSGVVTGIGAGISIITYVLPTGCPAYDTVYVNGIPDPITGPDSICQFSTDNVYYDDSVGGIFSISAGATVTTSSDTGYVNTFTAGVSVITYTLATGCTITDTIFINPNPTIIGASNLCIGNTGFLFTSVFGGSWISSDSTIVKIDSFSGVDSGVSAGIAIISYVRPTGCIQTVTITVNPLPTPIYGTGVVCALDTVSMYDSSVGGSWTSGSTLIATIGSSTGLVTGVSAGTTMITYKIDSSGCFVDTSILVNPIPNPITGAPGVCVTFDTIEHDASTLGFWTSSNPLIDTVDSVSGKVYGLLPGTDTIFYTFYATGCFNLRPFTVYPPPAITFTTPPEICVGGSTTLAETGLANTWAWSPAYGLSSTSVPDPVANPTITTTYTVIATSFFGCKDTNIVTVVVDTLLNHLKVVGRDSICMGACDTLEASGRDNTHFAWKPVTGLSCTICDTVVACPVVTTTYTGTAIDAYGCKDSVAFTVMVNPLPILSVDTSPVVVCRGTPKQIYAYGAWTYVWSPPYFLSCDTCSNPILTDTFNFVYKLVGTTQFGCKDSIDVRVSVLDTNVNWASNDTIICYGATAQLHATSHSLTGNLDVPSYEWIPPYAIADPSNPNTTTTPQATTAYSVVITENACFKDTIPVLVTVDPIPLITITPPSESVIAGTAVQMIANVTNDTIAQYIWTPAVSLSCDTCYNPIATPSVNTTYHLLVISNHGCIDSDTVTINIFCNSAEVFIPNTFTPNGDGVNDLFYVSSIGISIITRLSVYNRWGECVFQANNIQPNTPGLGWDGTYKGYVLEPDVFVYVVDAVCELGAVYHYKGDVSIVR